MAWARSAARSRRAARRSRPRSATKTARRGAGFEAEVGFFSRSKRDLPYQYFPSLEALADWCSVLMIAVRAGDDTHHVVNADIFKRLGAGGYVGNISPASVVDQAALVQALTDNT